MDIGTTVVLLGVAAAPLALLGGWIATHDRSVAPPVGGTGESWWRETMPWPHGVQEDDDIHWNFGSEGPPASGPSERADDATSVATLRIRPAVRRVRR
jgi:hypothetical protein